MDVITNSQILLQISASKGEKKLLLDTIYTQKYRTSSYCIHNSFNFAIVTPFCQTRYKILIRVIAQQSTKQVHMIFTQYLLFKNCLLFEEKCVYERVLRRAITRDRKSHRLIDSGLDQLRIVVQVFVPIFLQLEVKQK